MFSFFRKKLPTFSSRQYWENHYKLGGDSGAGSYNHLAQFKADTINEMIKLYDINSVVEFGCGDGNQLEMLQFPEYVGLDVSPTILRYCIDKFRHQKNRSFFLHDPFCFLDNAAIFKKDCAMSLDVLFHLVEEDVYKTYLRNLFSSANKLVIIYAADMDWPQVGQHELYRKFTPDIEKDFPQWKLDRFIKNKYPAANYEDQEGSLADFFIYTPKSK